MNPFNLPPFNSVFLWNLRGSKRNVRGFPLGLISHDVGSSGLLKVVVSLLLQRDIDPIDYFMSGP